MREREKLFKRYYNENNPTLKVAKHSKYKNERNIFIFTMFCYLKGRIIFIAITFK